MKCLNWTEPNLNRRFGSAVHGSNRGSELNIGHTTCDHQGTTEDLICPVKGAVARILIGPDLASGICDISIP